MGMNLNGPIYLQTRGFLSRDRNRVLDIGPQNVLFATKSQVGEFLRRQGVLSTDDATDEIIEKLVYFSTPRAGERTMLLSEITDLTNIEYDSIDVCPGLKTTILDLNFDPIPPRMVGYYDVVFNFGTTEHIFNQWSCFEFMHDALKVGGVVYHQLPASGYLNHGYYCYTPLFFREMAAANGYLIEQMAVCSAGESKFDDIGVSGLAGDSLLTAPAHLGHDNRVPDLNIHVILRKTDDRPFRASLEIATAHSEVNTRMLDRYSASHHGLPVIPRGQLMIELEAAKEKLAQRQDALDQAEDALNEAKEKLTQRQDALDQAEDALNVAKEKLAQRQDALDQAESRIEALLNSRSWRITAPLRRIASVISY